MKKTYFLLLFILIGQFSFGQEALLKLLKSEADRNMTTLKTQDVPAYYLSYRIIDSETISMMASFGSIVSKSISGDESVLHISLRVGSPEMDNTREIKGGGSYQSLYTGNNLVPYEYSEDLKKTLWRLTDQYYKDAVKKYNQVKANIAAKVDSEDKSADFSVEKPEKYIEKAIRIKDLKLDIKKTEERLCRLSSAFNDNKDVINSSISFYVNVDRRYFVDSDGSEIFENRIRFSIYIYAFTVAEDGMELPVSKSYFAFDMKDLPSDKELLEQIRSMSKLITDLKKAPVVESFSGPALLSPEAASVFFHEIFGHRIEGSRMKLEGDAQTFKKKIGEPVLPDDFSVIFDPQAREYRGFKLSGYYKYDDEGVKGQRVKIIENGVLKSFLMSRTPIEGFSKSNGHGRGQIYYNPMTRQSNMFVESSKPKTDKELRQMLIDEAKRTGKEYGYYFDMVSGGLTGTYRFMPSAFNVMPLVVYKIYADGRPDELVRGVNLVGTPLAMFSQVAACGSEYGIFNGICGAESGFIPTSCVTPAIYVKMVETQKKDKSQTKQPILERP